MPVFAADSTAPHPPPLGFTSVLEPADPAPGRSRTALALLISLVLVGACNLRFWQEVHAVSAANGPQAWAVLVSLFAILVAAHATVLLLLPGTRLLKGVGIAACFAGAVGAYFSSAYGISIDREMMRNVAGTDLREVAELASLRFAGYLVVLGLLPALAIASTPVRRVTFGRQTFECARFAAGTALLGAACVALLGASYASLIREHKPLRYLITPANIVYSGVSLLGRAAAARPAALADLESPVVRTVPPSADRPVVLFLVIGETARAENFQLGGYGRATNPELASRGVYYFPDVTSCGTSTAVSLPCLFSGSGRAAFDADTAARSTNLLDALHKAGIAVQWRDNNSGCKGVCARVQSVDYRARGDALLCNAGGCYDEVMLEDLPGVLARLKSDSVIVFHQAGSHGPAYAERYPKRFEVFKPACQGNELSRCRSEEVVNAYDNSLRYTDHNLARQIDALKAASNTIDGMLVYVSDHGESLGEKGLYLHGAPYLWAPDEQTRVPFLVWMSPQYRERFGISDTCVKGVTGRAYTHDNVYHTVLGAMGVTTARYSKALDALASCRAPADAAVADADDAR